MKAHELITALIDCDPDADIYCLTVDGLAFNIIRVTPEADGIALDLEPIKDEEGGEW